MKFRKLAIAAVVLFASNSVNASLVERLGGLAFYDTEAGLTWLADANYSKTSGYDLDGAMNWNNAKAWAEGLTVAGIDTWRLPDSDTCTGYGCYKSEMGNLFYNVLGNSQDALSNTGPFSNIMTDGRSYWSATEADGFNSLSLYAFHFSSGEQYTPLAVNNFYSWAVHTGDVSAVPVPAAVWLFGSSIIGLLGLNRKKKA